MRVRRTLTFILYNSFSQTPKLLTRNKINCLYEPWCIHVFCRRFRWGWVGRNICKGKGRGGGTGHDQYKARQPILDTADIKNVARLQSSPSPGANTLPSTMCTTLNMFRPLWQHFLIHVTPLPKSTIATGTQFVWVDYLFCFTDVLIATTFILTLFTTNTKDYAHVLYTLQLTF